jgi:hypothetical protein
LNEDEANFGMASVQQAAQELMELEALVLNLRSRQRRCLGKIESIGSADETTYFLESSDTKYLRIFEAQWRVYDYSNALHALWEFIKQCSQFVASEYSPMQTRPELIAVRNCMQHNGPIEINYHPTRGELVIPVRRVRKHGDWGGNNAPFDRYFPDWSCDDLVFLRDSVAKSDAVYQTISRELERKHTQRHSETELEQAAAGLSLYQ